MVRVKICGITRKKDIDVAASAGADAVGFISGFKSPRNLSLDVVEDLVKLVPPFISPVLVTTVVTLSSNMEKIGRIRPAAIQLYGRMERAEKAAEKLGVTLIKAVQVRRGIHSSIDLDGYDAVLTDTYKKNHHGGTGQVSDWDECRRIREAIDPLPLILSGGLNSANVAEAIRSVHPYAVDASSGVESSPGIKDARKVREFVGKARGA